MTFDVSMNAVVQALIVAGFLGVVKTLFSTVILVKELRAEFVAHERVDAAFHGEVREELRSLRA